MPEGRFAATIDPVRLRLILVSMLATSACLLFSASVAAPSPAPPRTFTVDVAKGSIEGLRLGAPASEAVRMFGVPDFVVVLGNDKTPELLWTRTVFPTSAWAIVTLRSFSSSAAAIVRFGGRFATAQGDRRGTTLAAFLHRWAAEQPLVHRVRRGQVTVEYNVVVHGVVFAFDRNRELAAVALASPATREKLCAIPSACVTNNLRFETGTHFNSAG